MTDKSKKYTNVFTKLCKPAFEMLTRLSWHSWASKRMIYAMALMYAAIDPEFWVLMGSCQKPRLGNIEEVNDIFDRVSEQIRRRQNIPLIEEIE